MFQYNRSIFMELNFVLVKVNKIIKITTQKNSRLQCVTGSLCDKIYIILINPGSCCLVTLYTVLCWCFFYAGRM